MSVVFAFGILGVRSFWGNFFYAGRPVWLIYNFYADFDHSSCPSYQAFCHLHSLRKEKTRFSLGLGVLRV